MQKDKIRMPKDEQNQKTQNYDGPFLVLPFDFVSRRAGIRILFFGL